MRRLVQYLTATQGKTSRVDEVVITNCEERNDPEIAAIEMEVIQRQNRKTKTDKTYHLLVSFRAGEDPNSDTLKKIEQELCHALGYSEHQRIAVTHRDTDNTHMHIAINKIHPGTFTAHTPYFDKLRLRNARIQIEKKYGLLLESETQGNHVSKAADMEALAGMESLESWVKRQCLDEMKQAGDWQSLHKILDENGLTLKPRGNGFIMQTTDGISVRASSIDRSFSKAKLEERYGVFEPNSNSGTTPPKRQYVKGPREIASPKDMTLHEEYTQARAQYDNQRAMLLQSLTEERKQRVAQSKALRDAEMKVIRTGGWSPASRLRYETTKLEHMTRVAEIDKNVQARRKNVYAEMGRIAWLPWLQKQAEAGREDAVIALRRRAHGLAKKFNADEITGEMKNPDAPVIEQKPIDAVTKKGTVLYQVGKDLVRNEANALRVSQESDLETFVMALEMAKRKFGSQLQINGDPEFKTKVINAAVAGKVNITFTNERMEKERKALLAEQKKGERDLGKNIKRNNER